MKKATFTAFCMLVNLFALIAFAEYSSAAEISVGWAKINIPVPYGFVDTAKMDMGKKYDSFLKMFVAPANSQHALFIPSEEADSVIPISDRFMLVQTMKSAESAWVSPSEFSAGRRKIRDLSIQDMVDKFYSGLNRRLQRPIQSVLKIGVKEMPYESESDNHIAFSILTDLSVDFMGVYVEKTMATSAAMVLAKNRIVFLYVYCEYNSDEDMEWTQNKLEEWLKLVIKKNPNSNFQYSFIMWGAIIGGFVGALIGAIIWFIFYSQKK